MSAKTCEATIKSGLEYFDAETKVLEAIKCSNIAENEKICHCGIVTYIYCLLLYRWMFSAAIARINITGWPKFAQINPQITKHATNKLILLLLRFFKNLGFIKEPKVLIIEN